MKVATNIQWDYDEHDDIILPSEIEIPDGIDDEDVEDYISDITGFCHSGYVLENV